MNDLHDLIADEKHIIECSPLSEATKVGQVYCYLSSGPTPMLKIGKGKNGRQRIASWLKEYPPSWRNGHVVFIADKVNQSTGETSLHKFFAKQRVPFHFMRGALDIDDWQRLPDGATEWFFCDTFVKDTFRSVGIDLVQIYKNQPTTTTWERVERKPNKLTNAARGVLGWTILLVASILAITMWGNLWAMAALVMFGMYLAGSVFPST